MRGLSRPFRNIPSFILIPHIWGWGWPPRTAETPQTVDNSWKTVDKPPKMGKTRTFVRKLIRSPPPYMGVKTEYLPNIRCQIWGIKKPFSELFSLPGRLWISTARLPPRSNRSRKGSPAGDVFSRLQTVFPHIPQYYYHYE